MFRCDISAADFCLWSVSKQPTLTEIWILAVFSVCNLISGAFFKGRLRFSQKGRTDMWINDGNVLIFWPILLSCQNMLLDTLKGAGSKSLRRLCLKWWCFNEFLTLQCSNKFEEAVFRKQIFEKGCLQSNQNCNGGGESLAMEGSVYRQEKYLSTQNALVSTRFGLGIECPGKAYFNYKANKIIMLLYNNNDNTNNNELKMIWLQEPRVNFIN